ncbi:MAG: ATP-binding protein [Gammaproteobacteria bacterium]|nr:ATP-binding protein [Gammaproteobacteria bacterium]
MIQRLTWLNDIRTAIARSRIVTLIGPRQCGKTTLAREFLPEDSANYFDLEDPVSLSRLDEPMTALSTLKGLVVIDEVQRRPDLFPVLRVLVDRKAYEGRFLILGSASGDLLRQPLETLAGRMESLTLSGFSLSELGYESMARHWLRGGFPLSYLAATNTDSMAWRKECIQALLERDFPQWGVRTSSAALWRFWTMLAHYHGQTWNAAEPARAMGVSESTIRRYLDLLSDAFMVRQLQPWHANLRKRQVKSPKIYIRDSGLLHQLLGLGSDRELLAHPKSGASWEGYVIEEVLHAVRPDEVFFWATHQGAEIDLVLRKNGKMYGVECKRTDTPRMTPSIRIALDDLKLEAIAVIYPGDKRFPIGPSVEAVPLGDVAGNALFD